MSDSKILLTLTAENVQTLFRVLSSMFHTKVKDAAYELKPLHGGTVGAVYLVAGSAELINGESIPYNVVLKKQKKWNRIFDPDSWRREYDLHNTGLKNEFTENISWPKCYHTELKNNETELWMDYNEGVTGFEMNVSMYINAAKELGRFQGKIHKNKPAILDNMRNLSNVNYIKQMYCHYRSWPEVYDYVRSDDCDIPEHICRMIIDTDQQEKEIWRRIEQLPIVLCHRDFWVQNIFCNGNKITVIDWDTTGWGYLGEDIASLIADEARVDLMLECYDKCVTAYYEGFSEYSDTAKQSDHLIHELIVVMFGYRLIEWYKFAKTPEERELYLTTLQNIYSMGNYK